MYSYFTFFDNWILKKIKKNIFNLINIIYKHPKRKVSFMTHSHMKWKMLRSMERVLYDVCLFLLPRRAVKHRNAGHARICLKVYFARTVGRKGYILVFHFEDFIQGSILVVIVVEWRQVQAQGGSASIR